MLVSCTGEFGVVYQGLLLPKDNAVPEVVAIKTLKGMKCNNCLVCVLMFVILQAIILRLSQHIDILFIVN